MNQNLMAPFALKGTAVQLIVYGKAMLILWTLEGESGQVLVIAESDGLRSATVTVQSR